MDCEHWCRRCWELWDCGDPIQCCAPYKHLCWACAQEVACERILAEQERR